MAGHQEALIAEKRISNEIYDTSTSDVVDIEKAPLQEASLTEETVAPRNMKAMWICTGLIITSIILLAVGIGLASGLPKAAYDDKPPPDPVYRRYWYIAAEPVYWTFAPEGNLCHEGVNGVIVNYTIDPNDVEATLWKGRFVRYTDNTFMEKWPGHEEGGEWEHLGLMGPTLFAEAGDTVEIHLRNSLTFGLNFEPNGLVWEMQGLLTEVAPNRTVIYRAKVPDDAGPPANSPENSLMYIYHSTVNPTTNDNTGLVGAFVVTKKGYANPDGSPKGVDRNIVTIFQIYFERESNLNYVNAEAYLNSEWNENRYTINGFAWCNLPGLKTNVGEKVNWYIGSVGSENGLHNFHWHGNTLIANGHHVDQFLGLPGTTTTAELSNDNPGTWLFHCHVNTHLDKGMVATYTVDGPLPKEELSGNVVEYFIAADEVIWNYAPRQGDACTPDGSVQPFGEDALQYLGTPEGTKIGSEYIKAQFREYTDKTFTSIKERPMEDAYMGLVGPTIRAKVGDVIKIHFRNNLEVPASMHPHGVLYNKSSEGAPYNDGTPVSEKTNDAVPPGEEWTYEWHVPERAGPGNSDESSMLWMYHSHADESKDTYAGLLGAIVITGRDTPVDDHGIPTDVDRELILFFSKVDETVSFFSDKNIERYLPWVNDTEALYEDEDFLNSALHHSINFFMYCNMPEPVIPAGSKVRFHIMSLGDETDMHAPNPGRGGNFLFTEHRSESLQMVAGSMFSVALVLSSVGRFELECGVQDHYLAGMTAHYEVTQNPDFSPGTPTGRTRTYYIQAQQEEWDYSGGKEYSMCTLRNYTFQWNIFMSKSPETVGSKYQKAFYRQYTDSTFTTQVAQPAYNGMFGPLINAEVGDDIVIVLKNALDFTDVNLIPGGGLVRGGGQAEEEGMAVPPGDTYTYRWFVPSEAGPTEGDLSTLAYGYSSTVDRKSHQQLGLVGLIHIGHVGTFTASDATSKAQLLLPKDVDYVVPLLWEVFDENASPLLDQSMRNSGLNPDAVDLEDEVFMETNMQHGINGFMYCTMPEPVFLKGKRVRWLFLSIGSEEGSHSPFFTGQLMLDKWGPWSSVPLVPYQARVMDMMANSVGDWPFWCQVHDHVEAGMMNAFKVVDSNVVKVEG